MSQEGQKAGMPRERHFCKKDFFKNQVGFTEIKPKSVVISK